MRVAFQKGLHELGDGLYAYLQPDGGWGWSNAGLIAGDGASLLVDTLYDLPLTRDMLAAMAPVLEVRPLQAALNTHGDPDHCFGNELLPTTTEIYASAATAVEMQELSPELLHGLKSAPGLPPELADFVADAFGPFQFDGITLRPPDHTFEGRLDLDVGGRPVSLVELGPAHTGGDTIVHVADAGIVFTGDLVFADTTPIVWSDLGNWLSACRRIRELDAAVLVPGHGPVSSAAAVGDVERYLNFVLDAARERREAGLSPAEAADDIDLGDFTDWGAAERIAANVDAAYRELDPSRPAPSRPELFIEMARWRAAH